MAWEQSLPMDQKTQFVSEYLRDTISFTELCSRYSISCKTGYKWINRYLAEGPTGLKDRSQRHIHLRSKRQRLCAWRSLRRGAVIPVGGQEIAQASKLDFVHFYNWQVYRSVSPLFSITPLFKRRIFNSMLKNSSNENNRLIKSGHSVL
jgi:transposase